MTKKIFALIVLLAIGALVISSVMADGDKPDKPVIADGDKSDKPGSKSGNPLKKYKVLELYQEYCDLQHQRDAATQRWWARQSAAREAEESAQQQLTSNSSDIEIHRQLFRAQIEHEQSGDDWIATIRPIDEKMDAIRVELKNRGEPPPR